MLFALGAKCGGLAASGLERVSAPCAIFDQDPSPAIMVLSATAPKPPALCHKNSRRRRRQKEPLGLSDDMAFVLIEMQTQCSSLGILPGGATGVSWVAPYSNPRQDA